MAQGIDPQMNGPTISAQFFRHVAHCLELTGKTPDPLLAQYGLSGADLDDPDMVAPLQDFLSFLEQAALQCANPHFGLLAGRLAGADSLGPLGYLFFSAPDLATALRSFVDHLATLQQASRHRLYESDGLATFEYTIADEAMQFRRQDAEYSIAAMYNFTKNYVGTGFEVTDVRFEHDLVGEISVYREFFKCDVYFNQDFNSFSFEESFLKHRGGRLDAALFPIIEEHLNRRASDQFGAGGIVQSVTQKLETAPLDATPTFKQVAESLDTSVATLNRKLRSEGVSWRTLLSERRMNAAARLLRQSNRSITEIALAVGFAESASFIRSFSRHFGQSPNRYRASQGQDGNQSP